MLGTSRILEKGPEYLRKQMELEREGTGRASAAERLAATKPNYARSPQVASSPSVPEPVTDTGSPSGRGSTERSASPCSTPASEKEDSIVKRNSSKKRPDSILLYRQKCDVQTGSPGASYQRKLTLLKSLRERNNAGAPASATQSAESSSKSEQVQPEEDGKEKDNGKGNDDGPVRRRPERVNVTRLASEGEGSESERARKGVSRSHSDISSRYSKHFADFDAFFKYCGLESDVVQSLGKENFSSRSDERGLSHGRGLHVLFII